MVLVLIKCEKINNAQIAGSAVITILKRLFQLSGKAVTAIMKKVVTAIMKKAVPAVRKVVCFRQKPMMLDG